MRYMHKKVHFNEFELQELEKRNPTLFELAQYVANKAHITARVMGENWINVNTNDSYKNLLCPSEVFNVPGAKSDAQDNKCWELRCWSIYNEPSKKHKKTYSPCWFRTWNEFVSDMKGV